MAIRDRCAGMLTAALFARLGWRVEQLETTVVWDGNAFADRALQ